jgi:hypothetical protein
MTPYRCFFGDAEYSFLLTHEMQIELEKSCGAFIGAIAMRVFAKQFSPSDIAETIRLAAIGAGMAPKRAAEMVAAYVVNRPLIGTYPIAAAILENAWFGEPHEEKAK